ncbi:MAG: SBBP repeat-containing protein [Rivularia sp. (in: cyanobacteria)]
MADSANPTQVTLSVDMMSVAENSGKKIKYTFTRESNSDSIALEVDTNNSTSVDTSSDLIVNFSIGGKAQLNTDYTLAGAVMNGTEYTVTIPVNATTAEVTITPIADSEIESDEAVKLTLKEGVDYIISNDDSQVFEVARLASSEGSSMDDNAVMAVITNDDPMLDAPWAKQFASNGYGYEYLAVDDAGNTYVTGDFTDTAKVGTKSLTSKGGLDVFVAKFDKDGNVQWAEGFGGTSSDSVEDITVDDEGNTYITGTTQGSEGGDVFVAKFNKDGSSAWREDFVNNNNIEASGIEVDAEGNTYFTGEFEGQVTFNTTPNSTTFDGGQFNDVFVAKLNSEGNLLWAKEFDNASFADEAEDIVVDKEGNAYLFMTEGSEGDDNAVLAKLNKSDGSEVWKTTFGDDNNYVVAEDIAIDDKDNIFITGEFRETVTFGNIPTAPTLDGGENGDAYLAKLDTKGDVLWVKDFDNQNNDRNDVEVEGIAVDDMGNTYVTGYYESESMSVGDFMLYSEDDEDGEGENAFITKFDSNGEVKWTQNLGGTNTDTISDIAVNDGKIYIAGEFYTEATFGNKSLKTNNFVERFIVKLEEEKPEVSLSVDSTTITEGATNQITYTFTRKGDFSSELTVDFSVSGSATFKDDYTLTGADDGFDGSKGKVTFKAGASTATVTLNIVDDSDAEENETVGLELAMGSGYMVSATEVKTNITITKDEKDVVIGSGSDDDDDDDDDDEGELSFTSEAKSTFKFKSKFKNGKSKSSIKFSFKSKSVEEIKEIGFFTVDDDEGSIDGISPDSEGYIEAALNRAQSILSVLGNAPQGFDLTTLDKVLEFSSDISFRFFSVKNGTLDGVKKGKVKREQFVFSSTDFLEVSEFEKNDFDLDFAGVKIKMKLDGKAKKAIGSGLQETIEAIDLRDDELTGKQKFKCNVNREAAFDNVIGFYQVIDEDGGIDTNGDGTADVFAGDAGYAEAAVQNRITSIDLSVENQSTATFDGEFDAGAIFVPFLIVDGTIDNFEEIYFSFIGANSDGADHVMMLGDNTFGFEDLAGGGDRDFNDMIVNIDFNVTSSASVST